MFAKLIEPLGLFSAVFLFISMIIWIRHNMPGKPR